MTIQVQDELCIDDQRFGIHAWSGTSPFDPGEHGLSVEGRSTACYRGHVCTYSLREDHLYLVDLMANLTDECVSATLFSSSSCVEDHVYMGGECNVFRDVNWLVPFTGGILCTRVGPDSDNPRYVELIFDNGSLELLNDCSRHIRQVRERYGSESRNLKAELVTSYLRDSISMEEFCSRLGVELPRFERWYRQFVEYGEDGLDDFWERCHGYFELEYHKMYWDLASLIGKIRPGGSETEDRLEYLEREVSRLKRQMMVHERDAREKSSRQDKTLLPDHRDVPSKSLLGRSKVFLHGAGMRLRRLFGR